MSRESMSHYWGDSCDPPHEISISMTKKEAEELRTGLHLLINEELVSPEEMETMSLISSAIRTALGTGAGRGSTSEERGANF